MMSLFERLGGSRAVDMVVETFYRKVLLDERINYFFKDIDMDSQILKQKAFLTMVFGGPAAYSGKDLRDGHKHLVERGLSDAHVDAVIELLGASLYEHGIEKSDADEVARIANSVRNDILSRAG